MQGQWIRTHCARFDHGGCGLEVLVENGHASRVRPDKMDTRSKGYVCPKGLASLERIYHPQRLLYPMKRKGDRGEGRWEKISWDSALDYAADTIMKMKEKFGPESIAFAMGAPKGLEYLFTMRLANLLGTPNLATTGSVCHWPRELMGKFTCGFLPVPDYENPTRCILLWGSNPFHTNEEGILGIHLKRSLDNASTKLIVIDPYETEIAKKADLWLQIRPGTDDLLALAFLNVIIHENLYDMDFVKQWTIGFDALRESIETYSPDRVSKWTWIPEEKIRQAARLYAESSPAVLHWGNALDNNGFNTSQTCRSIVILMAVTGNLDAPGGNVQQTVPPVMSLRKFMATDVSTSNLKKEFCSYYGISPRLPFIPGSLMIETILKKLPYAIKSLIVQGSNPLITYAGSQNVFRAIKTLDWLIVSEIFMTPTAALADLVLPAATNMEFDDIGLYGLPHGYVQARPKIIEPQGECWSDIKIVNEMGKRLGFRKYFWEDTAQCLEEILAPSGMNYKQFSQVGILEGEKKYYKYREVGFRTPSGKVEIRSSILERDGYAPVPFAHVPDDRDQVFPLVMTSAKSRYFFHSAYRQLASLRKKHGKPKVIVHPKTAFEYKITSGDTVDVVTPYGRIHLEAAISEKLQPSVVKVDYGWWFPERGEKSLFGWTESNINLLTSGSHPFDPVLGTTPLRSIPCRIEKR